MQNKTSATASRWETPFENVDADRLHLVSVNYPGVTVLGKADGRHFDLTQFAKSDECKIHVFSEDDETVYEVSADISAFRVHDEGGLPRIDKWIDGTGGGSFRLTGSELHLSYDGWMNGEEPTYCIATGWSCIEFICLNPPRITAAGTVESGRKAFH